MSRFSDTLLDHARSPRNAGGLNDYNAIGHANRNGKAPYTTIYLRIENDRVLDASFKAFGCGVTIASCSAVTTLAIGREKGQCLALDAAAVTDALDGIPPDKQFCAVLAIRCLRDALTNASQSGGTQSGSPE